MKAFSWMQAAVGLTLVLGTAAPAWAGESPKQQAIEAKLREVGDPAAYIADTQALVAGAKAGQYGRMRPYDIRRLEGAERKITALLKGRGNVADLDMEEKTDLFNARQVIDGIVSAHDDSRLVCKHVPLIGTRLKTTQCTTAAEAEARKRNSREALEDFQVRRLLLPPTSN